MKFRKWLALLLTAVMLLSLCACGDDAKKSTKTEKPNSTKITSLKDVIDDIVHIEDNVHIDENFTEEEKDEININTELPTAKEGVLNIALFGLDERGETGEITDETGAAKTFHADTVMILTIDRTDSKTPRIKLSSIARDTLVYVEGYNSKDNATKLCNAFDFGYRQAKAADTANALTEEDYKFEGAKTAIKTINYNFHMNITDYVYVNFVEMMDLIDYIGGVTIDVQQRELSELNNLIRDMEKECARDTDEVKKAGEQTLSGGQALAYARIRKIDSDFKRTQRCRDVLKAMFERVKNVPVNKLPNIIHKMRNLCHTTLADDEILELATWAITNDPEILEHVTPDISADWVWSGTHSDYGWVWVYDLDYAATLLIDFIYDKDTAADMPNETKVTTTTVTTPTGSPTDAPPPYSYSYDEPTLPPMP